MIESASEIMGIDMGNGKGVREHRSKTVNVLGQTEYAGGCRTCACKIKDPNAEHALVDPFELHTGPLEVRLGMVF